MKRVDHLDRGVIIGVLVATFSIGFWAAELEIMKFAAVAGLAASALIYLTFRIAAGDSDDEAR